MALLASLGVFLACHAFSEMFAVLQQRLNIFQLFGIVRSEAFILGLVLFQSANQFRPRWLSVDGTGLCSYRVRGVDGSCAKHLTVESYICR